MDFEARVVQEDEVLRPVGLPEFIQVRDLVVEGDTVWILDTTPPFVTRAVLGEPGLVLRFGASGRGPSELVGPVAMRPTEEGVDVWDPGNNKVVTFGRDGALIRSQPLKRKYTSLVRSDIRQVSYIDPWRIRAVGSSVAHASFPGGVRHTTDITSGSIMLSQTQLDGESSLAAFADYVPRDASSQGQFAAMPLWDACGDVVVVWDPRSQRVRWLGARGESLGEAPIELDSPTIESDDIERFLRHIARHELGPGFASAGIKFKREARRLRPMFGDRATLVADIRCESADAAWIQLFDMSQDPLGRGATWVRMQENVDPEFVQFPEEFHPLVFTSDGATFGVMDGGTEQSLTFWRNTDRGTR